MDADGVEILQDGTALSYCGFDFEPMPKDTAPLLRVVNPDGSVDLLLNKSQENEK